MKIKYTGKSEVFSLAIGQEIGNALVSPGQELDLPNKLAKSLVDSSQQFKLVKEKDEKSTAETDNKEEVANG